MYGYIYNKYIYIQLSTLTLRASVAYIHDVPWTALYDINTSGCHMIHGARLSHFKTRAFSATSKKQLMYKFNKSVILT